jgi:hypothetical protein
MNTACWLKLKQNHFNFTATVIFAATILGKFWPIFTYLVYG